MSTTLNKDVLYLSLGVIAVFVGLAACNVNPADEKQVSNSEKSVAVDAKVVAAPEIKWESKPPILPNPALTPGIVDPSATKDKICTSGYTATVRNVTEATKKAVFTLYNLSRADDKFEIDHLISLELGGANDIKNLWPQSYTTQPFNAKEKDRLENKMRKMVCSGELDLKTAQREISANWIVAYKKYIGEK